MLPHLYRSNYLYSQVRTELVRRIANGIYPPNSALPNEFVLSQEMQVSVGTIRKAIEAITAERLLIRCRGRGTIIADRQSAEYHSILDRIRNHDGTPVVWTFREIARETREASVDEQKRLQVCAGQKVIDIRRRREADGGVVEIEHVHLPYDVYGSLDGLSMSDTAIESLSVLRGVPIAFSDERISVLSADTELSNELSLCQGDPILRLERIVYSEADQPLEWRVAHCCLNGREYHVPSPIGKMKSG